MNDSYKHFYIGYNDRAAEADNTYDSGNGTDTRPSGHTQEYSAGYKFGYNNDVMVLAEPDNICPAAEKAFDNFPVAEKVSGELK